MLSLPAPDTHWTWPVPGIRPGEDRCGVVRPTSPWLWTGKGFRRTVRTIGWILTSVVTPFGYRHSAFDVMSHPIDAFVWDPGPSDA